MITLTSSAADQLQNLFQREAVSHAGLRVFVQAGGCAGFQYGLAYENTTQEGDTVVETNGIQIFLDPMAADLLEGSSIDFEDSLMGTGFRIDNPKAIAACAGGNSFRTEGDKEVEETCAP